jgi:hypothetical protein
VSTPANDVLGALSAEGMSHHLDIGPQSTGAFDGLKDRDHVAGRGTEAVQRADHVGQRRALLQLDEGDLLLFGLDVAVLRDDVSPGVRGAAGTASSLRRTLTVRLP